MTRRTITPAQIDEARKLRASNVKFWTYAELGKRYALSGVTVYYALNNHAARVAEERRAASRAYQGPRPIDPARLAERLAAIPADTRDLTARFFGDPLPGRSALDRMAGA